MSVLRRAFQYRLVRSFVAFTVLGACAVVAVATLPLGSKGLTPGMQLTSAANFSISGSISNLAPGLGSPLNLSITNPYTNPIDAITVGSVTVTVSPTSAVPSVPASCLATSNLSLQYNATSIPFSGNPPSATVTFVSTARPYVPANNASNPLVYSDISVLLATGASNSGCQNVTFPFNYSAVGTYTDATTTVVTSSANPANLFESVTYTATVSPSITGETASPGGTVTFYDAATPITCSLSTVFSYNPSTYSGTATCTVSYSAPGPHTISATFTSASNNFGTSTSNAITEVVSASSCLTLSTSGSNVTTISNTYGGNFEVTSGKTLYLNGGTITGNVKVDAGGALLVSSGTVQGNVQSSGGPVDLLGTTTVGGNVQTTNAQFSAGPGTTVSGNLQAQGDSVFCSLGSAPQPVKVKGNLQVQTMTNNATIHYICTTLVGINLLYQSNASPAVIGGTSTCGGNTVAGNLQVQSDTGTLTIGANKVTQNIQVQSNTALLTINGNSSAQNILVQSNTLPAGTYPPYSTLTSNTTQPSGNSCQLSGDSPGVQGSGNTVPAGQQNTCNGTA
jgi:hypothetical protein